MLKLAYGYETDLEDTLQEVLLDDKYKFYSTNSYMTYDFEIKELYKNKFVKFILTKFKKNFKNKSYKFDIRDDSWRALQFVNVNNDHSELLGFFSALINRETYNIKNLSIINFYNTTSREEKFLKYKNLQIENNSEINKDEKKNMQEFRNTYSKNMNIFAKDLCIFLTDLFNKYDFNKIDFEVIVGNPIEKLYDKLCLKYGGRIVGTRCKEVKLQDNKYYDIKLYEIHKNDYLNYKNNKKERNK